MQKLLSVHYNVETVGFIDSRNVTNYFSFTSKMSARNIFISYYTIDEMEHDEYEDDDYEELEDVDIVANSEVGSYLSVIMKHKNKYYEFTLYHNSIEIGFPIMLVQTILFLVKIIEEASSENLIEYLTALATDPLIPDELRDNDHRAVAYALLKLKVQTIDDLIKKDKAKRQ